MKNILIPTDFSENATNAISFALNLVKCERSNFYLIHAYADEVYQANHIIESDSFKEQKETIKKRAEVKLSNTVLQIKEKWQNPRHDFEFITVFEPLVDGVNNVVNEKNIDLVIMGTKGQTADKKITFGSHTVQVFKYVKCPVLAIPDNQEFVQPKRILFPSDYMIPYKRRELKLLDTIAFRFKSEVHSLYISDFEDLSHRQTDNKKFFKESLPNANLTFHRSEVKNKGLGILEYTAEYNMDMLVMVNSRHSFLEDMLYRSTVDQIALNPVIPFLVLQNLPR
ncbi:universal stress protein [Maribacter sp. PR1]|uniref:Universal stress protein n=1 Tax=Maribacter cobaltidurans TaxID=1178778 RepID=A0ABU7IU76_9FLAO|nr:MULTISPECIES: universal stress protein [Maribacter]MDC6389005.1 universal stress protein [Maribacter sp. PR1]MEE1976393.1 universal stress protein [Maribacter cobaltidurans]